jgi:hypothetical protein
MNTNFFKNCTTLQEVKELYRTLAKQFHPDKGGCLETMQQINSQYSKAITIIAKGGQFTEAEAEAEILQADEYKEAVNKVINLDGCKIELIGSWLWITGATKQHANTLKSAPAKFTWAKKKTDFSAWFFRSAENKTIKKGKKMELDAIRNKYGSQLITGAKRNYINS